MRYKNFVLNRLRDIDVIKCCITREIRKNSPETERNIQEEFVDCQVVNGEGFSIYV